MLELHGWGDLQPELNALSKQGKWVEMGELIEPEILNTFAVVSETIEGIGPEQLRVRELIGRISAEGITEVIVATNPNIEGEATAMYLAERLADNVALITRIARGIPVGGDLEYADEVTLVRAMQGRRAFEGDR